MVPPEEDSISEASRRKMLATGSITLLLLAAVAVAVHSSSSPTAMVQRSATTLRAAQLQQSLDGIATTNLDDDGTTTVDAGAVADAAQASIQEANATFSPNKLLPPALQGFVPHLDKVTFPTTWAAIRKTFGAHLDWAFIIAFVGLVVWAFVRYIRPKLPKPEGSEFILDENDVTASLLKLPGEEEYFLEAETDKISWLERLGGGDRVWKLAVTNKRIIAQKREATFFGTCQLGAREDCWPIENVHKVVVISGQFNGLTIPQLWGTCYTYFIITLLFDLLGGFVKDNIVDFFGDAAKDEFVSKLIWGIDLSLGLICNLLFIIAVVYAFAVMFLVILPTSILKVYLSREMEEEGHPLRSCSHFCCCGPSNSRPMESFTFATRNSYKAYQAIMSARAGAGHPFK
uniref:Uncharacterized protein n=1 Tax=Cryptomonas curvata TaxID=233186 RepID=A0A6T7XSN5_9CRYP